tara:strand:- start:592 stop:927 length:336 start_codon:yes stop_codon:yes gene_type:complete
MSNRDLCENCREKELDRLKHDLKKCQDSQKAKDKKIKDLDKKVFVLTLIAIGIGAILGKEALDSFTEWLNSVSDFRSSVDRLTGFIVPAPGTMALFAMGFLITKPKRKRKP